MLYNLLKIIHILSGSVVFCTLIGVQTYAVWGGYQPLERQKSIPLVQNLNKKTVPIVMLGIFVQILSGFSLISLHHINWQALWIKATLIGAVLLLINWGVFIGLLSPQGSKSPRGTIISLGLSIGILSSMIYFMANQTT